MIVRMHQEGPMQSKWCLDSPEIDIWVDVSYLATSILLEHDDSAIEDASWLGKEKNAQHIILVELSAVLKSVNMALMWESTMIHLFTDTSCVHKWITDTFYGKGQIVYQSSIQNANQIMTWYAYNLGWRVWIGDAHNLGEVKNNQVDGLT